MKLEEVLQDPVRIAAIDRLELSVRLAVEKTIDRYGGEAAGAVANRLWGIAANIKDKDTVMNVANIMSLEEIVNTIGRYEGEAAGAIAYRLGNIALDTKDKDAAAECARTIGRYGGEAAGDIAYRLGNIAWYTTDKDAVVECAKTIGRCREEAARAVAYGLENIAANTKDNDTVMNVAKIMSLEEIVNAIGRYEEKAAGAVAYGLGEIAANIKDKDAAAECARTIGRYGGEAAIAVAYGLGIIAWNTKDKGTVVSACDIVNRAGNNVLDLLCAQDFITIHKKGLDTLIEGKESLDAVAAYVKSGEGLPIPTQENIADYRRMANGYVSVEYGISKGLGMNQILMLFSVKKEDRKGLAALVNASSEKDRKTYSITMNDTEDRSLRIDHGKLPYLSLIAVVGSRDAEKETEARGVLGKIVGEKAIRRARNAFDSGYKSMIGKIAGYVKEGRVDQAIKELKDTKDEAINDVLAAADHRETGITGKNVLEAVESNDPLDYDGRVQIACVYLPRGYEEGIYDYCKDKRFSLIRYSIGGRSLGSAICYMEDDRFLVDSVEGHRTFRKPQIFDAVYRDLIARAGEKGAKEVIFSAGGINETPGGFMAYLKSLGCRKGKAKMRLDTEGYLEADEDMVEGYVHGLPQ